MKNKNAIVGLFVVAGLALFTLGLFLIGDRHHAFTRHVEYYAEFVNTAGISTGSKVRVAGADAGQVTGIGIPSSPSSKFRVAFRIDERLRGLVRTDSIVSVSTQGVVGDVYLSVRSGSPHAPSVAPLSTLPTKEPLEMSEVLAKGTGLLDDTDGALKQLSAKLGVALDDVRSTLLNVNDVIVGLKAGRGTAGMLLRDQVLAANLKQNLTTTTSNVSAIVADLKKGQGAAGLLLQNPALAEKVQSTIANVEHASRQADALVSDFESHRASEKLDQVITSAKSAAANVDEITTQLHQIMSEIAVPDGRGTSAGTNIRESLTNVNTATANLADDTEAVKHNFLLRGFFRQRGYYSFSHLSADKYRQDSFFTSPHNFRAWVAASELFENSSTGLEELSNSGKARLDAAIEQCHSLNSPSPIIIEGYSNGSDPVDQIAFSRNRAILVSRYLENRFHIDAENIGIVSMNDSPPAGLGHSTWNGICIVIPRKSAHLPS